MPPLRLLRREVEMAALADRLDRAAAGEGGVVLIAAPVGMGASTLLRAGAETAAADGFTALSARAAPLEREFAFGIVRGLLEPVPAAAPEGLFGGAAAPARALLLGGGDPEKAPGEAALVHALYATVVNVCAHGPVALFVDDANWADAPSLAFLRYLARRAERLPLLLVVAVREDEEGADPLGELTLEEGVTVLRPAPLDADACAEHVRRWLPDADDEFCAACHDLTGGNPLLLRELLLAVEEDELPPVAASIATLRAMVPPGIGALVRRRLGRLDKDEAALLRAAAVLDGTGDLATARALAGLSGEDADRAAAGLERRLLLARGPGLRLRTPILRGAIEEEISSDRRSELHRQAARLLEGAGAPLERVAAHLLLAHPDGDPAMAGLLSRAAADALRDGSPGGARRLLERALAEPPPAAEVPDLVRRVGVCLAYEGRLEPAEERLRRALELAPNPLDAGLAAHSLARLLVAGGRCAEGSAVAGAGLDALPAEPSRLRSWLLVTVAAAARWDLGGRAELERRLAQMRAEVDGAGAAWDRFGAHLLAQEATETALGGADAATVAAAARAAFAAAELECDESAFWIALEPLVLGEDLGLAAVELERVLAEARRRGLTVAVGLVQANRARVALARGDVPTAADLVEDGLNQLPADHFARAPLEAVRIETELEQGAVEPDGIGLAPPTLSLGLPLLVARARQALERERPDEAVASLRLYGELLGRWGGERLLALPWRSDLALAEAAGGRTEAALALAEEEVGLARAFGAPRPLGVALRTLGTLRGGEAAEPLLEESCAVLAGSPARLEYARALVARGEHLIASRRLRDGRELLREAVELASECGARALSRRALGALRSGGGPAPRLASHGAAALTPAQRRVAELAAAGLRNREIAEQLEIAEKTVETHLGRVYAALDIKSRWQLADRLASGV
ncbi:MAG TPA: AAA family ATPase [Solirubrobacterales bacterium]|nr:AAA family ATPase [Solirubrobacterales bacterium]